MKNTLKILINLASAYCAWLALHGSAGASHIIVFISILAAAVFLPIVCVASRDEEKSSPLTEHLSHFCDLFMIAICAWLCWYWCAGALFLSLVSSEAIYIQRAKNSKSND